MASKQASKNDDNDIYTKIFQQAALCTYKDPDLPMEWKLARALEILGQTESLAETKDPETLGIAGAIHKRLWEMNSQRQMLERALFYYLKGYALGLPSNAQGASILTTTGVRSAYGSWMAACATIRGWRACSNRTATWCW